MTTFSLLGPLSSASPVGAPWFTGITIIVAGIVLVRVWTRHLRGGAATKAGSLPSVLWVTLVCIVMIALSVYQLSRK
jgi:hypothetical protein